MSDLDTHSGAPDSDLLAAEYVLGVLALDERRDVERRASRDAVFARAVSEWEMRLLPWANSIAPVEPPAAVWQRILTTLPGQLRATSAPQTASLWGRVAFWRGFAIGAMALAAASIAALFIVVRTPAPLPLMASIDGGGHRHFVATVDTQRGQIVVSPAAFSTVADRVPELWLIAPGSAPKSLGLLNAERPVSISIPSALLPQTNNQAVLAVSLEPPGGSKTGAPTGPVVAQGKLTNL